MLAAVDAFALPKDLHRVSARMIAEGADFIHRRRAEALPALKAVLADAMAAPGPTLCTLAVEGSAVRLLAEQPHPEFAGARVPWLDDIGHHPRMAVAMQEARTKP